MKRPQRDISAEQFRTACEREGFRPEGFKGCYNIGDRLWVSILAAGPTRREQLAYLMHLKQGSEAWEAQTERWKKQHPIREKTEREKEADARASQLFDELNRKYWHGRLPKYRIVFTSYNPQKIKSGEGTKGSCENWTHKIFLSKGLNRNRKRLRLVLLHEMCHIGPQFRDSHGPRWLRKIARLVRLGETELQEDFGEYATPFLRRCHGYLAAGRRDLFERELERERQRQLKAKVAELLE